MNRTKNHKRFKDKEAIYRYIDGVELQPVELKDQYVESKDKTVGQIVDDLDTTKRALGALQAAVYQLLQKSGVLSMDISQEDNLDLVEYLRPDTNYTVVQIDEENIIKSQLELVPGSKILSSEGLPKDIEIGYYKYTNGKVVLDEKLARYYFMPQN